MTSLADIRKSIVASFDKLDKAMAGFWLVLGRGVLAMREHGMSWADVHKRVNEWIPTASTVGLSLSEARIRQAASTAQALDERGALVSPAGVVVEPEALAAALNPSELDRAAAAIAAAPSTKHGPKLRVNDAKALVDTFTNPKAKPEAKAKAKLQFMQKVQAVENHNAASAAGDELALARQALERASIKVTNLQNKLADAKLELEEARLKVAALTQAEPIEEPTVKERKPRGKRVTSTAQVQQVARG